MARSDKKQPKKRPDQATRVQEQYGGAAIWEEALEKYGGTVKGRDFWSERLPEDHAIRFA